MGTIRSGRTAKELEQLILYILANYNNENLTITKLNKLLYFCDFNYFEKKNASLTKSVYMRNNFGPTLKGLTRVIDKMIGEGKIKPVVEKNYYGGQKNRFTIVTDKLSFSFDDEQRQVINDVNDTYRNLKPSELSLLSHFDTPFLAADLGSDISYGAVAFRDDSEVTEEEREQWKDLLSPNEKANLLQLAD